MNDNGEPQVPGVEPRDHSNGQLERDLQGMHSWPFPPAVRDRILMAIANGTADLVASGAFQRRRLWARPGILAIAAIMLLATTGIAIAVSGVTNLGKPTNTTSTTYAFPLSGFHKVKDNLRAGKKPELLFLAAGGTSAPDSILVERWPIVKALSQFGRLSGVKAVDSTCHQVPNWPYPECSLPTFDLSHARYTSPYLAFSSKDLIKWVGQKDSVYQKMSPAETRMFDTYAAYRGPLTCFKPGSGGQEVAYHCHGYLHLVENSLANPTTHHLPLLMIGDYIQTSSQDLVYGDFEQQLPVPTSTTGQSGPPTYAKVFDFNTVHNALLQDKDPIADSHLVEDVNAEANIMMALICHADGKKPASVCSRPVIKSTLKHVK